MINKVVFPPFFDKQKKSKYLNNFFRDYNISNKQDYFDLNILREVYKENITYFKTIVTILSVKGFNFDIDKKNVFFPKNLDYSNVELIRSESNTEVDIRVRNKMGLLKALSEIEVKSFSHLDYHPLSRLEDYSTIANNELRKILLLYCDTEFFNYENEYKIHDDKLPYTVGKDSNIDVKGYFVSKDIMKLQTFPFALFLLMYKIIESSTIVFNKIFQKRTIAREIIEEPDSYLRKIDKYSPQEDELYEYTSLKSDFLNFILILRDIKSRFNKIVIQNNLNISFIDFLFKKQYANNDIIIQNSDELKGLKNQISIMNNSETFNYCKRYNTIEISKLTTDLSNNSICLLKNNGISTILDFEKLNCELDIKSFINNIEELSTIQQVQYINSVIYLTSPVKQIQYRIENNIINFILKEKNYYYRINTYANNIYDVKQRDLKIIEYKDKDLTLEEIGSKFNLTRERVRQVAKKVIKQNSRYYDNYIKMLKDFRRVVNKSSLQKIPGLVTYLSDSTRKTSNFLYEFEALFLDFNGGYLKSFVYDIRDNNSISLDRIRILGNNVKNILYQLLYFNPKYRYLNDSFINIKGMSKREIGEYTLKLLGKTGYNDTSHNLAKEILRNIFGLSNLNKRNMIVYLSENKSAIIRDLGSYIHADFINPAIIKDITEILENAHIPKEGVQCKILYNTNKEIFNTIGIDNYAFLYGLITYYNILDLSGSGRGMRIAKSSSKLGTSLYKVIDRIFREHDGIMTKKQIKQSEFFSISQIDNSNDIIKYDDTSYILTKSIRCSDKERSILKSYIEKEINQNKVCSFYSLIDTMKTDLEMIDFLENNKIMIGEKPDKRLVRICEHIFSKEYHFSINSRTASARRHKIHSISSHFKLVYKNKRFTESKINEFLEENGYHKNNRSKIINECYQINEEEYQIKDDIYYSQIILDSIISIMEDKFNDNPIIHVSDLMLRLKLNNINLPSRYEDNEILLASLLSDYDGSNFSRPKNDVNIYNNNNPSILQNNKICGYNFSDGIRKFVKRNINKVFTYLEEVNDELLSNHILSHPIRVKTARKIFGDALQGGGIIYVQQL